jgi:hypothetical protein
MKARVCYSAEQRGNTHKAHQESSLTGGSHGDLG